MGLKAKICVFLFLATAMCAAHAEYYLVYPAPACVYCEHPHWVAHHYYHHRSYHHVVSHRKHHPCYDTSIYYYSWQPVVPACACGYFAPDRRSCGGGCGHHAYYDSSYDQDNANYDPDMSTGDDDATVNPDMDIDN